MKKKIALCCALLAVAVLIWGGRTLAHRWRSPRRTLERMLDSLAAGRLGRAEGLTREGALGLEEGWRARRFYKRMFSSLSYTISSVSVKGDTAVVTVTVTMYDMRLLLAQSSLASMTSGGIFSSSYYRQVMAQMKAGRPAYSLHTAAVTLRREKAGWRVSMSDSPAFAEAIVGGAGILIGY